MDTKSFVPKSEARGNLNTAIEEALQLPTEKERILAVIETIRCYRNEYVPDQGEDQRAMHEGYEKCRSGIIKIQSKVKGILNEFYSTQKNS